MSLKKQKQKHLQELLKLLEKVDIRKRYNMVQR